MPKFDDLPMPAQNEIRQARGETEEEHPQKTRMSLLQRLANVGLGRRDEETEPPIAARASGPAMPDAAAAGSEAAAHGRRSKSRHMSRYQNMQGGPRRRDWTSMAARHLLLRAPQGDDHLDIPAFLRRQAN